MLKKTLAISFSETQCSYLMSELKAWNTPRMALPPRFGNSLVGQARPATGSIYPATVWRSAAVSTIWLQVMFLRLWPSSGGYNIQTMHKKTLSGRFVWGSVP